MTERTQQVITALVERLKAIDQTFGQRTVETERMLGEHTRSAADAFGKQTSQLGQVLANNSQILQQTANQVGAQSKEAVGILTSQTQTLREVSRNLLDQIHGLTQRFESQGQAILTAAKALDSSNTKIDSILDGRHQAIIALLHTVNTKGQELDRMMKSYAGMVENAMVHAETRAKQAGSALARDTASQAQQAVAQIERLREEAQAHTARAVNDLKGTFEQIITQIGRQLEQMRGQFDNTSRGMHEAAQKTASDLDGLRKEMQNRMETLPEQTAQTTAAIRKALSEQVKEIEASTTQITRAATQAAQAAVPSHADTGRPCRCRCRCRPHRCRCRHRCKPRRCRRAHGHASSRSLPRPGQMPQFRRLATAGYAPQEQPRPSSGYDLSPVPRFDARGRQVPGGAEGAEMDQVTNSLAQQLTGAAPSYPQQGGGRGGNFGTNDILSRAQELSRRPKASAPATMQPQAPAVTSGNQLRLDELARAVDQRTAADVWHRLRAGDRGALGRHIYSLDGQATFDEIVRRYERDGDFRMTVDRYMGDFERLLGEAEQSDPDGRMLQNYLVSETGRVYLLLAHASGRLR